MHVLVRAHRALVLVDPHEVQHLDGLHHLECKELRQRQNRRVILLLLLARRKSAIRHFPKLVLLLAASDRCFPSFDRSRR